MVQLGDEVKDTITGFKGTVTGIVEHLNGCRRAIVQPQVGKDGKLPESQWVDEPQLTVTKKKRKSAPVKLVKTGGPITVPADRRNPR